MRELKVLGAQQAESMDSTQDENHHAQQDSGARVPPSQPRLITYISGKDALPDGWMLYKRRKHSEGDIEDLETHLKDQYGINGITSGVRQRSQSTPASTQPVASGLGALGGRPSRYTSRGLASLRGQAGNLQQRIREGIYAWNQSLLNAAPWGPPSRYTSMGLASLRGQAGNLQQSIREGIHSWNQSLLNAAPANFQLTMASISDHLPIVTTHLSQHLQQLSDILAAIVVFGDWILTKFLFVFKGPLVFVIGMALFLNVAATLWTVMHDSFLDNFCPNELPIIRGIICRSWDKFHSVQGTTFIEQNGVISPLEKWLGQDPTVSYGLPIYLSRLDSLMRSFRGSLPESEFSESEQTEYRRLFTTYVDQSGQTIRHAQEWYDYMMGLVELHISDTAWLLRLHEENGISSRPVLVDGFLARIMAFCNSYHIVYLINGLEPFQREVTVVTRGEVASSMKSHVREMSDRLLQAAERTEVLGTDLADLSAVAETIEERGAKGMQEVNRATKLQPVWTGLIEKLLGPSFSSYQIKQRKGWLVPMKPVMGNARQFLRESSHELRTLSYSCLRFSDRLGDGRATKYAWNATAYVEEQAKELSTGVDNLIFTLTNFKTDKLRFNDAIFDRYNDAVIQPTNSFKTGTIATRAFNGPV